MEELLYNIEDISKLPYTLSHPLEQAYVAYTNEKYGKAMNHILDFFEISVPFCSYIFLRMLQQEMPEQPAIIPVLEQFVNKIDMKRPLSFGDWLNDLFTPLLAASVKFMPQDPLAMSFAANIYVKRRNVLLGSKTMPSIVQIRNEYRGHSTTLSEEIYHGVDGLLLPRICSMIEALKPLASCSYDIGEGRYKIDFPVTGRQIDLYPLVFCNNQDYRYVLHTLKDEQTCYVASNENAVTNISYDMNDAVDKTFQQIVPSFDIAKDLNWAEIKKFMQTTSAVYLKRVYAEKKYNQELFVEREELTNALKAFHDSDKTLFPLIGEAGQGKTTQLAYWTERLIDDDMPVLTLAASDFSFVSLDMSVKSIFGFSIRKDIKRLIDNIHYMAEVNGQDIYIFVDALNECLHYADTEDAAEGPLQLYQSLCRLFINSGYMHFKLLFTCRNYTWTNLVLPHTEAEQPYMYTASNNLQVRGFCDKDAAKAYRIYQQLYQMRTPYEQLDARVALRLRDPLTLKITSGIFLGKNLSDFPDVYTSIALYNQLYEDIGNSYAGNRQRRLLDLLGSTILDAYLSGEAKDSLLVDDIRLALPDSHSPLHELASLMYRKDGVSIAYAELLHKAERPVLKEVERQSKNGSQLYVQFIYERFLEYVVGRAFVSKHTNLQAKHFHEALEKGAMDVIFLGAMRNALIMTSLKDGNFNVLIELERKWGDDFNMMSLVNDTMNTMISENYEDELFDDLMPKLINGSNHNKNDIAEFNDVVHTIQNNAADTAVIERHKELSVRLAPVMRLKKLASVSLINGMLLSDFYNENLYTHDALALLWKIITDEIYDVRNDACMYIYYLSKRAHTNGQIPLRENLTVKIVKQIYSNVKSGNLIYNVVSKNARTKMFTLVETSTRLAVLLIIDNMLADKQTQETKLIASDMLDEIKGLFKYLTCNLYLVKAVLPFLQVAMKRQVTFQTDYVNNAMEYQTFWEKETFADIEYNGASWEPHNITDLMNFCCYNVDKKELEELGDDASADMLAALNEDETAWRKMHDKILSAYKSGDSLSLFVIERSMIIMGVSNWENVAPIARSFFCEDFRKVKMFDYAQMSILYSLYQIAVKTKTTNRELLNMYACEAVDWTRRLCGLFKGHRSSRANVAGKYKRNLMSWYSAVYCTYAGECGILDGDERCVPAFYELIDEAINNNDRELLIHLIDNIMELVTDMGYYNLALDLLKYIMMRYDSNEKIENIDNVVLDRKGIYEYGIVKLIGNVLSTAKNYCPDRVNIFIQRELSALPFPGISSYQDSILNYNPSGESLQDVLTHKFGNFLIFSLLYVRPVDIFAIEAICAVTKSRDSFAWFEQVVKILIKHLFQK